MTKSDYKNIALTVIGGIAAAYSVKLLKQWGLL